MSAGLEPVMSRPLKVDAAAASGARKCVSRLKQVVLPGSVGADEGVNASAPHAQAHVLHRDEPAKLLGEPLRLEDEVVGHQRARPSGGG